MTPEMTSEHKKPNKVGLCSQQVHCSVQKPLYTNFEANCKTQVDCERMVNHCKKMYPVKQLTIGYQRYFDPN